MRSDVDLARVGALIGDPARARMLTALMSGASLTATELALEAGVTASTASAHLAKLTGAEILAIEKQGRHRYFRIFDARVAAMLEEVAGSVSRAPSRRPGPTDPALRLARVCYDHLAGERGVWLFDRLRERLDPPRASFFAPLGIDVESMSSARRPLIRHCLDWSERRHHLGGALGAAILDRIFAMKWARRERDSRAVIFTPNGERALREWLG